MPFVNEPAVKPSALDYVPPGSVPYRVKAGDTWWSLADLPGPRSKNMRASDLCFYNFRTRKSKQINWYLKTKVGCTRTTRDGKNYVFNEGDAPGIIYLPSVGGPVAVTELKKPKLEADIWYGLVIKTGMQNFNTGHDDLSGFLISLDDLATGDEDDPQRWMMLSGRTNRTIGIGGGMSGGLSLVAARGFKRPSDFNGHVEDDFDFNLALGGAAGKAVKTVTATGKYARLISLAMKIGAKTPAGFRRAVAKNPEILADIAKTIKGGGEGAGAMLNPNEKKVLVLDLPIGGGLEGSVFYGKTTFTGWDVGGD